MSLQGFQKKSIASPPTIGARFYALRKKKQTSLEAAESETRIRSHYLAAIEEDRFSDIPASHVKGFVRRYGKYLGLSTEAIEEEIARIPSAPQSQTFSPDMLEKQVQWFITPRLLAVTLSLLVFVGFIGYVTYQVRQFTAPPHLTITQPQGEAAVTSETIRIEGTTDPGTTLSIDSIESTVGSDGHFAYPVTLRPGVNQITVKAENRIKKQTVRTVSILYNAPPSPSPTPQASPTATPSPTISPSPKS